MLPSSRDRDVKQCVSSNTSITSERRSGDSKKLRFDSFGFGVALLSENIRPMLAAGRRAVSAWCVLYRRPLCALGLVHPSLLLLWYLLLNPRSKKRPSLSLYQSRNQHCQRCPLFDQSLKTCGTPGQTYADVTTRQTRTLGCLCYLPLKNAIPCNCWARNVGLSLGWPDQLNSFPELISSQPTEGS